MSQSAVIDTTATVVPEQAPPPAQPQQSMALQRSEGGALSTKAMTVEELHDRLEFVRTVMRNEMKEGQDYGKIPGAGDKPSLLQPGAQKLLMVFGLTVSVKKEVLREFAGMPMHREYEFTLTIQAPNGKTWDGVGTCSTLEKKYRYRKGKRLCPHCRKDTIIQGKAEFGGGWLCWAKKGGCGAKFEEHDEAITSQSIEDEENEDPAEQWNTVRKMAYKRALVHGSINATNTSELWTQDVEDNAGDSAPPPSKAKTAARKQPAAAPARKQPPSGPPPQQQKPATDKAPIYPDEGTRKRLIEALNKSELYATALEYFRKLVVPPSQATCLLPTETIENLPLQYVPVTSRQMWLLNKELEAFANGHSCQPAYPPNALKPVPPPAKKKEPSRPPPQDAKNPIEDPQPQKPIEVPRDKNPDPNSPDAPWRSFPIPFGNHVGEQLAKVDKKVLFGFWANWRPQETWIDSQNVTRQTKPEKLARERIFRQMLDEAGKHYGFVNPDAEPGEDEAEAEQAEANAQEDAAGAAAARAEAEDGQPDPTDDDVPF